MDYLVLELKQNKYEYLSQPYETMKNENELLFTLFQKRTIRLRTSLFTHFKICIISLFLQ